jgi:SAM-dependent methyltransferase
MRERYREFFVRHPEFLSDATEANDLLTDTFESFTRQRLDLRPPGSECARQWTKHLRRNLGGTRSLSTLRGKLILDVGCGFGRDLYVASEAGAEVVGVDLSGGVDVARLNNLHHPRCHLVQADFQQRPFREGLFDIVWSFGVLHHLPDPHAGFVGLIPFARSQGGEVRIWVYGYRGMAFTYRLSHMRFLHDLVRELPGSARVRISQAVAALLSLLYWEPLRLVKWAGAQQLVEKLPLSDYVEHRWSARVAAVHDRLSTPVTHFLDREELLAWCQEAKLSRVQVEDTDQRGWRVSACRGEQEHPGRGEEFTTQSRQKSSLIASPP